LERADVIVVGAGPAGCAAAAQALLLGMSVTIIDKFTFPRDKLCGGLVTGRSMKILQDLFEVLPDSDLFLKTNHIRLWAGERQLADKPAAPSMYMTMRKRFDHALLEHCQRLGASIICGTVNEIGPTYVKLRDDRKIAFDVLIGADGANSMVARLGLDKQVPKSKMAFGLEIEAPRPEGDNTAIELDLDAISWGYGWSFPKHNSRTIGVGGLHSKNPDAKKLMKVYRDKMAPQSHAIAEKGAFLPFGHFLKTPGKDRIIVAGDAAGLVDPITGEGIALALESGALAGKAAHHAISRGAPSSACTSYKQSLSNIHRDLRYANVVRFFMFHWVTRGAVHNAFARSSVTDMYLRLLNGSVDYPTIAKRVLKKVPILMVMALRQRIRTSNKSNTANRK
jgi:geranylgeranyl reductase family protein